MEHLPPVGWVDVATKHDLDPDIDALRREIAASCAEVVETLRAELHAQTRLLIVSMLAMMLILVALAFAVARFA